MNIFSYIKTKIHILDIVSEYTKLKRAGSYWKGQCPFHSEKTASFTVSPDKGIFYCFGCHVSGDVITFIAKMEGYTPIEAVNHISTKYNIPLPEDIKKNSKEDLQEKDNYFNLCKAVSQWLHEQLKKSPHVMQYMKSRGFTNQSIDLFNIGYFPAGFRSIKSLVSHASKHALLKDDLVEANILAEGKNGTYSPFEDRIIFPIKDMIGRFCGFGGRVFRPNDQRAKYYNSHENPYFNKGSLLFGFDIAKKSLKQKSDIFLVEGYTDCIAMSQHGFANTVATLGTSCSLDHLKTLSRYIETIYVLYDGDNAGQKAILRLTELCWQVDLEIKVLNLPKKDDPASFLENGGNIKNLIKKEKDIFVFFIDVIGKEFLSKPLSQKLKLAKTIINMVNNLQDPIKKDLLMQNASKSLGIPIESIKIDEKGSNGASPATLIRNNKSQESGLRLEKKIFFAIINNMKLLNKENEEILVEYFPTPIKEIFTKLKTAKEKQKELDFITFFDTLEENERKYVSKVLLEFDGKIEQKTFDQLLLQFHQKNWKLIVQNIKTKLSQTKKEGNENEVAKILLRFSELKKKLLKMNG